MNKRSDSMSRHQLLFLLCAALTVCGGIVGGGPGPAIFSMFVELIACATLALALIGLGNGESPREALPALILTLLIALLPVLQLIPLPVGLWRALPGHDVPNAISQLAGQGDMARPLTLSPETTRLRGLALIVPIAMFAATLQLGTHARDRIVTAIVLFAFASAVLGVFQVATGSSLYLFSYSHFGYPVGFFANRNHQADLMLIAMPLSVRMVATLPLHHGARRTAAIGAVAFFAVALIATQSRTALLILPITLICTLFTAAGQLGSRRAWMWAGAAVATSCVLGLLLFLTPVGQHAMHRFHEASDDLRPQFWRNTIVGIREFWPTGSGLGSFVPVYDLFEDLDYLNSTWVNHAHNDYLEILLETGIAGAVLLLGYAVLLVLRLIATSPERARQQRLMAVSGLVVLLLHSATDYPLRTFVLLTAFAFFNGLLFPPRDANRTGRRGQHPASPQPNFAGALP